MFSGNLVSMWTVPITDLIVSKEQISCRKAEREYDSEEYAKGICEGV
jgi:hypothetical protein